MAETTTNMARRVCKKMGIEYDKAGEATAGDLLFYIDTPEGQYILAMLCVLEGVSIKAWSQADVFTERYKGHKMTCYAKDLIRTILSIYLWKERG